MIKNGDASDNTLMGTAQADTLNGLGGNDTLYGFGGADKLNGGEGMDAISFASAAAGVKLSLASGKGITGEAAGDLYSSIENVVGSNHADGIVDNGGANLINTGMGNDTVRAVVDTAVGYDTYDGGAGTDTLDFSVWTYYSSSVPGMPPSPQGVYVNLGIGKGANGDTLLNFENIIGTAYNDSLVGSDAKNVFNGGDGYDTFTNSKGGDIYNGGASTDQLIFAGDKGANVDLAIDTYIQGGQSGTVKNVENIFGSTVNDIIKGGSANESLSGNDGHDVIWGREGDDNLGGGLGDDKLLGHAGNDTLWGDVGIDTIGGGAGADTINAGQGNDELMGGTEADVFTYYEFYPGSGQNHGYDTISDFTAGTDKIRLLNYGYDSIYDLEISQGLEGVLIDLPDAFIYLKNVEKADLSSSDFLFT